MTRYFIRDDGSYDEIAMACHVQRRVAAAMRLAPDLCAVERWTADAIKEVTAEAKAERDEWIVDLPGIRRALSHVATRAVAGLCLLVIGVSATGIATLI